MKTFLNTDERLTSRYYFRSNRLGTSWTGANNVLGCLVATILLVSSGVAQSLDCKPSNCQSQTAAETPLSPSSDVGAVVLVQKAIEAQGGNSNIDQVGGFTASGSITYFGGTAELTGPVSVKLHRQGQFRLDAEISGRQRSTIIDHLRGHSVDQLQRRHETPVRNAALSQFMMFPALELNLTLKGQLTTVKLGQRVSIAGKEALEVIIIRRLKELGGTALDPDVHTKYYLDASTFLPLRRIDMIEGDRGPTDQYERQIDYNDYRIFNNVMVPLTVSESISQQKTCLLSLSSVHINETISDRDFNF